MSLYIISKNSNKYKKNINNVMSHLKFNDYTILDPEYDDLSFPMKFVVTIGNRFPEISAGKEWHINILPESEMSRENKIRFLDKIKEIKSEYQGQKDNVRSLSLADIPGILTLEEFINEKVGEVIEIKFQGKLLGIYPDSVKLQGMYDDEYHASTIVNLARIKEIFGDCNITIKEI